ncbi:hypothetical protein [Ralstonia sp. UBA689]|uniref:hypothetical protein n=1 Tax=Ralstonia sp. UBA689 TaxID=1947373 RepID=UPI0025F4B40E|nr:hypothetical protein [Ralstonia sp. UBA689]
MIGYSHFSIAHLERANRRKLCRLRRQCVAHYDAIVTRTDSMLRDARALIPEAAGKFIRLYNAVDLDRIRVCALDAVDVPAAPYTLGRWGGWKKARKTSSRC